MHYIEIISLVVTVVCVVSFSVVFTILFRHYYMFQIEEIKFGKQDIGIIDNAIYEASKKKSKASKALSIAGRVASYTVFGLIGVMFCISLISRISGNAMLFGNETYVVIATGSMSEKNPVNTYLFSGEADTLDQQFLAYDVINIKKYESQEEVELYDVVAFKNKNGTTIVHRITKILSDGTYITRGDANKADDTGSQYNVSLKYEDIIGRYTGKHIRGIGIIVIFLQSNSGIITVVSVLYCIAMYDHLRLKYLKAIDDRTKYLIDTIGFDVDNSTLEEVEAKYREYIKFNEKEFTFDEEGKYLDPNSPESETNPNEDNKEETKKPSLWEKIKNIFKKKNNSKSEVNETKVEENKPEEINNETSTEPTSEDK